MSFYLPYGLFRGVCSCFWLLTPFRQWVFLHFADTFIHGPFNFATINGRRTRDRVDAIDWAALRACAEMYSNPSPSTSLPTFCVQLSKVHVEHHIPSVAT